MSRKQLSKNELEKLSIFIAGKLSNHVYAIRGTASLVLQGFDMNADDIDVICDEETSLICNEVFKDYVVNKVEYKESPKFRSFFGSFNINGVQLEIMGRFQIKNQNGIWSKVYDGTEVNILQINGIPVRVTTPGQEMEMFLEMGRFNAYQKLKKQVHTPIKTQPGLL